MVPLSPSVSYIHLNSYIKHTFGDLKVVPQNMDGPYTKVC